METVQNATIKSIVTNDFRAAAVFEKYSLDFCCKGGVTIDEACSVANIDAALVYNDLAQLVNGAREKMPHFAEWPVDELTDYIVNVHHTYVREATPVITAHSQKVASVHGNNHPEVIAIARHFESVAAELQSHMMKEERVLFPYFRALVKAKRGELKFVPPPFGTVQHPIQVMEAEHQAAGEEMNAIHSLAGNYVPPKDACTTYCVSFKELQQFEQDLHEHVFLENNILFPKAVAIERELMAS